MSYLSNTEESELKRLKALTDDGVLDDGEFRDAKSTILEVAKRRRLSTLTEPRAAAASTAAAAPTASAALTPTAAPTATATAEALMAPAAAAPSAAVPPAASGVTQASSNFFTGKKSLGSLFHVSVAFNMHLIKPPKRNSHCNPLQVKDTSSDVSGYAKFSNAQNANLVRFSNAPQNARQSVVDKLWKDVKSSFELLKSFNKKGGSRAAWEKAIKDERKSRTSGPNGGNGSRVTTTCGALASTTCRGAGCAHRA